MMRPLSTLYFIKNNKRHILSAGIAIVVAIIFLFLLECFIESMLQSSLFADGNELKQQIEITCSGNKAIPASTVSAIEKEKNIERVIPAVVQVTEYEVYGAGGDAEVYGLRKSDVGYFMKKHGATVKSGRLPESGKKEIAMNALVAKNKNLKLGDYFGSDVDKAEHVTGKYKIVGLLSGNIGASLVSDPYYGKYKYGTEKLMQGGMLAFPKEGKIDAAGAAFRKYSSDSVEVMTLARGNKMFDESCESVKVMDIIAVIAVIVMAVCLVCAKYAQFYSRKAEFGILHAMGFSRRSIMMRALREVVVVNAVSLAVGVFLGILCCYFVIGGLFQCVGGVYVIICAKAIILSIIAPLFTTLFTLIPVFRMLSSLDAVSIIEEN